MGLKNEKRRLSTYILNIPLRAHPAQTSSKPARVGIRPTVQTGV